MATRIARWGLLLSFIALGLFGRVQAQDVSNSSGDNVQSGDNRARTSQRGSSDSGDASAGQTVGVVSSGSTRVDATNRSTGVDATSGDATGNNRSAHFTGLNSTESDTTIGAAPTEISDVQGDNVQDGDNRYLLSQSATAQSGDAIGGQVIGAVTSATGDTSIVAANRSEDSSADTGDATAENGAGAFVGLNRAFELTIGAAEIADVEGVNVQEGDNRLSGGQTARASSGDGVVGQVLGSVGAGRTLIDATNLSADSDVTSGDATATNEFAGFVGLHTARDQEFDLGDLLDLIREFCEENRELCGQLCEENPELCGVIDPTEISDVAGTNIQLGDNRDSFGQRADADSGDSVGGQVAGVVTAAGGSAELVLNNRSVGVDATSGDATMNNRLSKITGLVHSATTRVGRFISIVGSTFSGCAAPG